MKKVALKVALVTLTVVVLILSLGISVAAAGNGHGKGNSGPVQGSSLTTVEENWIVFMREEEKLARDVYLDMYDEWGVRVFSNIAASEQKHMDAILKMLVKYDIPDPVAGNDRGEFTNEYLQQLYDGDGDIFGHDNLIDWGLISVIEAYHVGVFIEETDIDDLDKAIEDTDNSDIVNVYENLRAGSYNHLAAFESHVK